MRSISAALATLAILTAPVTTRADEQADARAALQTAIAEIRVWTVDEGGKKLVGCGVGALIADRALLTAGHVLFPDQVKEEERGRLLYEVTLASGRRVEVPYKEPEVRALPGYLHGRDGVDLGVLLLPPPEGAGWGTPVHTVQVPKDAAPSHGGLIYSFQSTRAVGLAACKGDADERPQGFVETTADIDDRGYRYQTERPRLRVSANLSPGYSGSPWVLAPCGAMPYCITGVYVFQLPADVGGGLVEMVDEHDVPALLQDAGAGVSPYQPAQRSAPASLSFVLSAIGESYQAGPVFSGRLFGGRGEVIIPLLGLSRRWHSVFGLYLSAAFLGNDNASVAEPVVGPVGSGPPLSSLTRPIDEAFEATGGAYVESPQFLKAFWRAEAGGGWVGSGYTNQHGDQDVSSGWLGQVRGAVSLPLFSSPIMLEIGVATLLTSANQQTYVLSTVPGAVNQATSSSYAYAASLDFGVRILPGDPL